jgi:AbiV family abortive infection protein
VAWTATATAGAEAVNNEEDFVYALRAWDNCARLLDDAQYLLDAGRYVTATLLGICVIEEDEKGAWAMAEGMVGTRVKRSRAHGDKLDRAVAGLSSLLGEDWESIVGTQAQHFNGLHLKALRERCMYVDRNDGPEAVTIEEAAAVVAAAHNAVRARWFMVNHDRTEQIDFLRDYAESWARHVAVNYENAGGSEWFAGLQAMLDDLRTRWDFDWEASGFKNTRRK